MSFFRANNTRTQGLSARKRGKRIVMVIGTFVILLAVSYISYLYASGSRIFDKKNNSLFGIIKGEQSETFKEERVNILVMGRGGENHPGGMLTDSLMIFSIRPKDKKMAITSIPRDLLVPIKGHSQDKINSAYADGYNDYMEKSCKKKDASQCKNDAMISGASLTRQTVSEVFDLPIHYYVVVDFVGFEKLVDQLGGLDINVEKTLYDPLYPDERMVGYSPFTIKAGQQHLDGKTALKYARSRETTSDFDRAKRQQQILEAMKDKAIHSGILTNPKKILDIVNIVGDHVRTDLGASEIKALAELMQSIDTGSIINKVLDSSNGGVLISDSSSGTYYLKTKSGNFNDLRSIVKNIFNTTVQYEEDVKLSNASGVVANVSKITSSLEKYGFVIIASETIKTTSKQTIINNYTGNADNSAVLFLKEKLTAQVVSKKKVSGQKFDIEIIIGQDFKGLD